MKELLASTLLSDLKIAAPETALIRTGEDFLAVNPDVNLALGARAIPVEAGWQFGSRYPGDSARTAVYDLLSDALPSQVVNLEDFRAIPVFDKRVSNADGRRSVF